MRRIGLLSLLIILLCGAGTRPRTVPESGGDTFSIKEVFGVSHPNQVIDFDLTQPIDPTETSLVDDRGVDVAYQVLGGGRKLAVQTDLPAGAERMWTLVRGRRPQGQSADAVHVRRADRYYEITNALVGVRIVRPGGAWGGTPAPIQGLRMRDGTWTARGPNILDVRADRARAPTVRFLEEGPLKVVVEVSYRFDRPAYVYGQQKVVPAGPGFYTSTVTVEAGQPSILFEENTDMDLSYSLDVYEAVHPTHARYRGHHARAREYGYEPDGRIYRESHTRPGLDAQVDLRYDRPMGAQYVSNDEGWRWMAVWDPWAFDTGWYWQMFDAGAPASANLLGIFAGRASRAVGAAFSGAGIYTRPGKDGKDRQAGVTIQSYRRSADARVFPRTRFQWGMFLGTKADLAPPDQVQNVNRQMNRHAGISLAKVHRYQLQFPDPLRGYGGLYMDRQAVGRMSARLRADHSYYRQLYDGEPTSRPLLDMWADVSGEKTHHAAQTITGLAHDLLAAHVNGEGIYSMRFHYWHGGLEMMRKGLWIDQVLGSGALTPDEQARVKAAAVLFANVLWDDDVVPLFEGHGLNLGTANMPVQQQAYRDFYALLLAEHPTMRDRAAQVATRVRNTVGTIVNEHGAEMGGTHYIAASFVPTLNTLLQVKQRGGADPFATEPRLAKFAEFYLNLLTPPEPRVGGKRALISLGDSSTEPSEMFGTLGTGFRDADPQLSARLMGAWQAAGNPQSGFFGTTLLTIDDALPAADPQLGDATFPGYYSVLRHGWGTRDETAAWIVNGDFYADHRHADHGSVVIYALGAPLSIDWGSLYTPHVPGGYMHSGVVMDDSLDQPWDADAPALGAGRGWGGSTQEAFVSFPDGAYVRSRFARGTTVWTRAITSIRTDASYPILVVRDTFRGAGAAAPKVMTLNLMATGEVLTPAGKVNPPLRTHAAAEHTASDPAHQRPSVTPPFALKAGVNRLGFSGRYGVDWDVYIVSAQSQQALIGNWAVTPWGAHITDKEERQHILRVHGVGPFTTVILPWRRGERPAGLTVTEDGDAILVKTPTAVTRIEPDAYSFTTTRGTVARRFAPTGRSPR